jgi:cold shock CspA family protein
MPQGHIKRYFSDRHFGFVVREDGNPDIFFHLTEVASDDHLVVEGARVSFDEATNLKNGKLHAVNVVVVP